LHRLQEIIDYYYLYLTLTAKKFWYLHVFSSVKGR